MEENKQFKIKLDLRQESFEAEGSEEFVQKNLKEFKDIMSEKKFPLAETTQTEGALNNGAVAKKKNGKSPSGPTLVKDLNLRPSDKESLKDFYAEKAPGSNIEKNVVFVYYLEKILEITGITINHILTCYGEINLPIPINLRQSIVDTSSTRYGYLNGIMKDLKISVKGGNFVQFDLPRAQKNNN